MSLSVYLKITDHKSEESEKIFVREYGKTYELSREEWDMRYPGMEPATITFSSSNFYSNNITHNLGVMAWEAGIYQHLWRPEELGITKAKQLIEPLTIGWSLLMGDSKRFKAFNPENKWGDYEGLCRFVAEYLAACMKYPDADVSVSR